MRRPAHSPTDDAAGIGIDDEGHIDEALPCGNKGEVGEPQHIRPRDPELPVDVIARTRRGLVGNRGAHALAPVHALQVHTAHQPLHSTAGDREPLALELPPDLARAIDASYDPTIQALCDGCRRRRGARRFCPC